MASTAQFTDGWVHYPSLIAILVTCVLGGLIFLDSAMINWVEVNGRHVAEYMDADVPLPTVIAVAVFGGPINYLTPLLITVCIVLTFHFIPRQWKPISLPELRALSSVILLALLTLPACILLMLHGFSTRIEDTITPIYSVGNLSFVYYIALGLVTCYHLLIVIGLGGFLLSLRRPVMASLVLLPTCL